MRGLGVAPRAHVPTECGCGCGWGMEGGGLTDIREQLPDSLARPGLSCVAAEGGLGGRVKADHSSVPAEESRT